MQRLPAPIDREGVSAVLAPTLAISRTLPAEAYLSPDVSPGSARTSSEGSWVCVGRGDDLSRPGEQRAVRVGNGGTLVRGPDATLHAFSNTAVIAATSYSRGARRSLHAINCPYHAWVYSLDGALAGAPRFGDVEGFRKEDHPGPRGREHAHVLTVRDQRTRT